MLVGPLGCSETRAACIADTLAVAVVLSFLGDSR
jgi:hypothetical protein